MTKRRKSPESDVVSFFSEADPAVALTLFRVVRGILEQRGVFSTGDGLKKQRTPRRLRGPLLDAVNGDHS
jgi:hypothetical protein